MRVEECHHLFIPSDVAPLKHPLLKGLTAVLGLVFALFAGFQINDANPEVYHRPSAIDAWSWVTFYGLVALCCLVSIFLRVPRVLLGLAAAFCVFEMVRTAPGLYDNLFQADTFTMAGASMAPSRSEIELSREFFGALIGLAAVAFIWWQATRARRLDS